MPAYFRRRHRPIPSAIGRTYTPIGAVRKHSGTFTSSLASSKPLGHPTQPCGHFPQALPFLWCTGPQGALERGNIYLFIMACLLILENPVTRVVRAVSVADLAPPAAYHGYLVPYPLAPPNKPTNFGLDLLPFVSFRLSCSSSLVHQVLSYGLSPVVLPISTRIPRLIFRAKLGQLT